MTVTDYKEKLTDLHDAIKENPFRKDYIAYSKYGEGYFETIREFVDTFYALTKAIRDRDVTGVTDEDKKLTKIAIYLFFHDFRSTANYGYNHISNYNATENPKRIKQIQDGEQFLETCISCVHCYLETGLFNRYPFKKRNGEIGWATWSNVSNEYLTE